MKKTNKGFSLVELIIVIAIMAILAGAIAPALIKYIDKSRKSNDVSSAKTIKTAIETALGNESAYEEIVKSTDVVITFKRSSSTGTSLSDGEGEDSSEDKVETASGSVTGTNWNTGSTVTYYGVSSATKADELIADSLSKDCPKVKFKKKNATTFVAVVDSLGVVSVGVSGDITSANGFAFNDGTEEKGLPMELTPDIADFYQ
jgi:type IV pilus assembly protein PilA